MEETIAQDEPHRFVADGGKVFELLVGHKNAWRLSRDTVLPPVPLVASDDELPVEIVHTGKGIGLEEGIDTLDDSLDASLLIGPARGA